MTELTEAEVERLNQGRLVRAEASIILPSLGKKKGEAIMKLIGAYKQGKTNELLSITAEISAYADMEQDIKRRNNETEQLERRAHAP